jgi:hypothetical protein
MIDELREKAKAAWRNFRKRSKYFQYKALIGAIYVTLIVATVIVVVPSSPSNRLKAYVLAARADFVAGSYILVRNDSRKDWDNVVFTLNGTHRFLAPALKAGDKVRVDLKAFAADGRAPLSEAQVRVLDISTSRGSERYTVSFLVN